MSVRGAFRRMAMNYPIRTTIVTTALIALAGFLLVVFAPFLFFYVMCSFFYCDL